jgi:hypothetical protein
MTLRIKILVIRKKDVQVWMCARTVTYLWRSN